MPYQLVVAFFAGVVSVITPCVLPLVPGYLSVVSSVDPEQLGEPGTPRRVAMGSLPFIAGFTVVFVALGVASAAIARVISPNLQNEIAGFILVVVGLAFLGVLPIPKQLIGVGLLGGARRSGSRALLGAAFATCAAPCIGPVLAGILVLAGDSSAVFKGAVLLFAYSIGLGAAFMLAGVSFAKAMGAFRWLRDRYQLISAVGGAVLVALGLLLFFDRFWWLRAGFNHVLNWFGLGA